MWGDTLPGGGFHFMWCGLDCFMGCGPHL